MAGPKIFVSHSHRDDEFTASVVKDLEKAGAQVWVDVADVRHGDFMDRINAALAECEWVVLVLTQHSLESIPVRTEVNAALNLMWHHRIKGVIPLIAGPHNPDDIPPTWSVLHFYDATRSYQAAITGLLNSVGLAPAVQDPLNSPRLYFVPESLDALGFVGKIINGIEVIIPPMCNVPEGPFLMGSDMNKDPEARSGETPLHEVILSAYQIGRYHVTVAEYTCAVRAGVVPAPLGSPPVTWETQLSQTNYPVVFVSWNHAVLYARWLSRVTGESWRLPTEAEWEKAARGTDSRSYPWGNRWDPSQVNTSEAGPRSTTPIGTYPSGASPYGVHDMAGNVWEYCSSLYGPYPYNPNDGRENLELLGMRAHRGSSYDADRRSCRTAWRDITVQDSPYVNAGFRLVRGATQS